MARETPHASRDAPRVVLADDHALMRMAVAEELECAGFAVCAQVGTGPDAVDAALRERPDLCILDVSMPGGGLAAAAEILRELPSTRIVMLTASDTEEDFLEAVRAGASGYLLKTMDPLRLPASLWDVLAGVPTFPRRLTSPLIQVARDSLGPAAATPV
jgi:two-component system nitrate/nitrite response regulator NarL